MAGQTASSMILFIAAVAAAGIAGVAIAGVIGNMALELQDRGNTMADALGTDVAIVNDPANVPYDSTSNNLTLYIKNTGSHTLTAPNLMILIDGTAEDFNHTLRDDATSWSEGVVLEAWVIVDLAAGDHQAHAIYTPNISDDLEFRV